MSLPNESTAINSTNTAPYLSADRSELAPLYSNPQENKGLRVISSFFAVCTVLITLALAVQIQYGSYQLAPHGTIVTDDSHCTSIGAEIIKKGGNAVDGAIASAICMGVVNPHLTGLGGGGLMLIYDQRQRRLRDCLDFRVSRSRSPGIGVPGFVAGLYQASYLHGILSWRELLAPSIELARMGFKVPDSLLLAKGGLKNNSSQLFFWLEPLQQGQTLTLPELADALTAISSVGPDAFYNGTLTKEMAELSQISPTDLAGYKVDRGPGFCIEGVYNDYKVVVPSQGSGGPLMLKTLDHLNLNDTTNYTVSTIGRALHGNPELSWPLHTGSVVVTTDRNDLYVTVVSGLGSMLGSQLMTSSGFIMNNGLEVGSESGGSRATMLAVPFVAIKAKQVCGRRLISGAPDVRDGLQLLFRLINSESTSNVSVKSLVEAPRARFTSSNTEIQVWTEDSHQPGLSTSELDTLVNEGFHHISAPVPYPSLNVIQKVNDLVNAYADTRGEGEAITY